MTFTKKEREALARAAGIFVATSDILDHGWESIGERMFWLKLQAKLDAWAALHGEGDAAIQRARDRNAKRVKSRLDRIAVQRKAKCDCGAYHRVTISRMGPSCRARAEAKKDRLTKIDARGKAAPRRKVGDS